MSRILFWVLLAVVVYVAIVFARSRRSRDDERTVVRRNGRKDPREPVAMIECPECGTHFPEDEAVLGDGVAYCSERCRKAARRRAQKQQS